MDRGVYNPHSEAADLQGRRKTRRMIIRTLGITVSDISQRQNQMT